MTDYTPTTQDVSDGFSLSYTRDYVPFSEGWYEASRFGVEAFKRWLAEHDRQVAEAAFDEGADQVSSDVLFWHPQATGPYNPYRKDTHA